MEQVYKCIRNPSKESCVDLDYSAVEEYLISLRQAYNKDPTSRNAINLCECAAHTAMRDNNQHVVNIEKIVKGKTVREMLEATCCPAVPHIDLRCGRGSGTTVPKFIPWKCVHDISSCEECGIDKLLAELSICPLVRSLLNEGGDAAVNDLMDVDDPEAPIITDPNSATDPLDKIEPVPQLNETTYPCRVWCKCKIQNSSQSQMELRSKERSWRQLAYCLRMALPKARRHHIE